MKPVAGIFTALLVTFFSKVLFAQSLPVGTPLLEERWRTMQLKGMRNLNTSFLIRPIQQYNNTTKDSIENAEDSSLGIEKNFAISFAKDRGALVILPVILKQQNNSNQPYGWNDGSMIPARGYQQQLTFGFYSKLGPLSIQLMPEMVYAANKNFSLFPSTHTDSIWKSYYYILNRIDNPERFGNTAYTKFFWGQSSVRLNSKKLSIGLSNENLWWGPGMRNALLMSNNAPGFKHLTFNTLSPVVSPIGSFEWQIVAGLLKNSTIAPPDTLRRINGRRLYMPKNDRSRYLNGMVATWQPKWTKGLHLGFSRVFYQYSNNIKSSINGYLPVLGSFFKKNANGESSFGRDQLLSVFFRLILPAEKAEVYAEYGRNDHSIDLRDFLLEPEHARAYIIGARKIFTVDKKREVELFAEFTHLQNSETRNLRELEGWYTHYQIRHGYTNVGQVLGAGIGPGGNSQTFGIKSLNNTQTFGFTFERIVRNNDFYYDAFTPRRNFYTHWVDLSFGLNATKQYKRFIFVPNIALVKSLNYQWKHYSDVINWHTQLSTVYMF